MVVQTFTRFHDNSVAIKGYERSHSTKVLGKTINQCLRASAGTVKKDEFRKFHGTVRITPRKWL